MKNFCPSQISRRHSNFSGFVTKMLMDATRKSILLIYALQRNFNELLRTIFRSESSADFQFPHIFVALLTVDPIVYQMDYKNFPLAGDLVAELRKNFAAELLPLTDFVEIELYLKFLHVCWILSDGNFSQPQKTIDDFSCGNIEEIFGITDDYMKRKLIQKLRQFRGL